MKAEHIQILKAFRNQKVFPDGWATALWIAESCGHFYDTPWASSRIQALVKRGFLERGIKGYYRITDTGLAALEEGE